MHSPSVLQSAAHPSKLSADMYTSKLANRCPHKTSYFVTKSPELVVCVALHIVVDAQTRSPEVSRLCGAVVFDLDVPPFGIGVPCSAMFCSSAIHRITRTKKTNSDGAFVAKGL